MKNQYGFLFQAPTCRCGTELTLAKMGPFSGPGWTRKAISLFWICENEGCLSGEQALELSQLPEELANEFRSTAKQQSAVLDTSVK